jgi:tryptophan synthase alpha chain
VTEKADGGIIGTAFVNILLNKENWRTESDTFIRSITD